MSITKDQAQMLTTLAIACRPTSAARWDTAGVMAAIARIHTWSLPEVIADVISNATDPDAQTPGVIGKSRKRWAPLATPPGPVTAPVGTRCTVCGGVKDSQRHHRTDFGGHPYSPPREHDPDEWVSHVADLRAELAPTSPPPVPLTRDDFAAKNPELHERLQQVRDNLIPDAVTREPEEDQPTIPQIGRRQ